MSAILNKMTASRGRFVGILVIITCLLAAYAVFAQGSKKTMKYKSILHPTQRKDLEAGDVPDHRLIVGENKGLIILDNGDMGTYTGWWLWDETERDKKEQGSGHGYGVLTFADGSTIVTTFEGAHSGDLSVDSFSIYEKGTLVFTKGTGKYKGIKGTGTYSGKRFAPGAENCYEMTVSYTLP